MNRVKKIDHRKRLQRAIDHIESDIESDIDLEGLSEKSSFSMYHFGRLFTIYTGLAPIEYVRRRKMLHAARAIVEGQDILSVAIRYGYSSHSAFAKAFKKVFGCSPSAYRHVGSFGFLKPVDLYTQKQATGVQIMKVYETERLIIRNFQPTDWQGIQELASNKQTSKASRFDHAWPTDVAGCRNLAEFFSKDDSYWAICLKKENALIGFIGFNGVDGGALDFGHLFHTEHSSLEITTEAIRRMIQYVFDELDGVERIVTHNAADWKGQNEPLQNLGMKKTGEGMASFSSSDDGTPNEFLAYTFEVTKEEWSKHDE